MSVEADAAGRTGQAGEVLVEHVLVDADGLEQLRAGVGGQRRDAHLGHHLQHALAGGLDVVLQRGLAVEIREIAAVEHVLDRLERHVRVDRGRAEADQRGHVVHLAGVAGLDDQADLGAGALPDQVVVHRRDSQQRRDRRQLLVGLAVGQHDDPRAVGDRRRRLAADVVERRLEPGAASATGYRQRITLDRKPCWRPLTSSSGSRWISLASSSLRRIGCGSTICRHESASG